MPVLKLALVALFLLVPLSAQAKKDEVCVIPQLTNIVVNPDTKPIEYDYSTSLKKIQGVTVTTDDPHDIHGGSITQGFMQGQVSMNREIQLDHTYTDDGRVCLFYKDIKVDIEITPKIVIAREIKRDRCMFKAVLDHEMKHIKVDRDVVNETARSMGNRLYQAAKDHGFIKGPLTIDEANEAVPGFYEAITKATEIEYNNMALERHTRQSAIDTYEEYARVASLCPGFHEKRKALYQKAQIAKKRALKDKREELEDAEGR